MEQHYKIESAQEMLWSIFYYYGIEHGAHLLAHSFPLSNVFRSVAKHPEIFVCRYRMTDKRIRVKAKGGEERESEGLRLAIRATHNK